MDSQAAQEGAAQEGNQHQHLPGLTDFSLVWFHSRPAVKEWES
jgi:hypothetical protein